MAAITADRMSAIRRASRALRGFFIFMAALLVLGTLNKITHPFPPGARMLSGVVFQGASITTRIQILWLVQNALATALNLKILYHLIRLTGLFAKGKLFTTQNVAQIRQVGFTFMSTPVVWLVGLIGAVPEIVGSQGQWTMIMPTFPGSAFINGVVFLFASWIMNEGRELRDEQDLVV